MILSKKLSFIDILVGTLFFISSADKVFVVNIGGLTFRSAQLLMVFITLLSIIVSRSRGRIVVPIGTTALLAWLSLGIIFLPNTEYVVRNIGYVVWAILSIVGIFSIVQLYGRSWDKFERLVRIYLFSFVLVSIFGLLQFIAGLFGKDILVSQWIIPGKFVRINGFSYEPSYFALYTLLGWGTLICIYFNKCDIFLPKNTNRILLFLSLTLILSTSKTGIGVILAISILLIMKSIFAFLSGRSVTKKSLIYSLLSLSIISTSFFILYKKFFFILLILTAGSGLFGAPSHSVNERVSAAQLALQLFYNSPIIGVSFGGIGPANYMQHHAFFSASEYANNKHEASNVFFEMLASVGIVGFSVFMIYLIQISLFIFSIFKNNNKESKIIVALYFSFLLSLLLLIGSDNILRVYLWNHVAVLSAGIAAYRSRDDLFRKDLMVS